MSKKQNNDYWTSIVESKRNPFYINAKEIWDYRDLVQLLVRRDIVTVYKQTILGIFWFLIPPLFTTIIYVVIFSGVAKISTNGTNPVVFYMTGIVLWNFFNDCVLKTSLTFRSNESIFSKVYFPRLIAPISSVLSAAVKFFVQFALVVIILFYYNFSGIEFNFLINFLWLIPILIFFTALVAMGLGILISSLSTKYRDLGYLTQFGLQLLMYATPVIYPMSSISEKYRFVLDFNPMASFVEVFRYIITGNGILNWQSLSIAFVVSLFIFFLGLFSFNKVEKNFVDTI
jgi:lipopolysaccharide transport system permease protein